MMRIFRVAMPMIVKRSVALVAGTRPTIPDQKVDTVGGDKIIDPCTGRIAVLKQATATAHGSPTPTVAEGVEALTVDNKFDEETKLKSPAGVVGLSWPESLT